MNDIYDYDVVLSFAGENRDYVDEVATYLREKNISVFYDMYEQTNLWGKNLYIYLNEIYKNKGKFCVVFISSYYKIKLWTNHELKSAFARAFTSSREYILPARFDDTEIPGLDSTVGFIDLRTITPRQFAAIITEKVHDKLSIIEPSDTPTVEDTTQHEISLDQEIEAALNSITIAETNPVENKILSVKSKKFTDELQVKLEHMESKKTATLAHASPRTLCPIEQQVQNDDGGLTIVQGKHFSLPELPGHKWLILEVYVVNNYETLTREYDVEPLDSVCEQTADGTTQRTFFIDDPMEDGNQIILLNFAKNEVFINMGILLGNEVHLPKYSKCFLLHSLFRGRDNELYLSNSAYNLSEMTDEEKESLFNSPKIEQGIWHQTSIDAIPPIIVDPEKAELVKRELYYDECKQTWASRININPYKSYFAFTVKSAESNTKSRPLTALEIGTYYRLGDFGFPQDPVVASRYLSEDGSAEALYQIAQIFQKETDLADEDIFLDYLQQSADGGYGPALLELAIYYYSKEASSKDVQKFATLLRESMDNDCKTACFFVAYFTEIGLFTKCNLDEAFEFYFKAAESNYKPAQFRLSYNWEHDKEDRLKLHQQFLNSIETRDGTAQFCAGSVLFYGLSISDYIGKGVDLLIEAAELGNFDAQYELFKLYDSDGDFEDKEKALKYLCSLCEKSPQFLVNYANRLIDGVGCEISFANDQEALQSLQKAILSLNDNKIAINNLGWMYKNGRGCQVDFKMAKALFEKAAKMGCASSQFHLGNMYEFGMGVAIDLQKAFQYYQGAADLGNKKAKEHLLLFDFNNNKSNGTENTI